jgi:glutaredoxin
MDRKIVFCIIIAIGAFATWQTNKKKARFASSAVFATSPAVPVKVAQAFGDELVIYSASWCPYCRQAKEWFDERKVVYRECDIEKESICGEHMSALGTSGIPVIVYKGKVSYGFRPEWMEAALK